MEGDLEDYRKKDAASARYINKQENILAVMWKFLEAADDEIGASEKIAIENSGAIQTLSKVVRSLVLVCDAHHVDDIHIRESLYWDKTTGPWQVEMNHELHCYLCNDSRHQYYINIYKNNPCAGGIFRMDEKTKALFKEIGLDYDPRHPEKKPVKI